MSRQWALARLGMLVSLWLLAAVCRADKALENTAQAADTPGAAVFRKYCVLCHGAKGEGDGVAARQHKPRPANLRRSLLSDAQKEQIIREGGRAVGRSDAMPPWRHELSDRQIKDLMAYLAKIRVAGQRKEMP